MSCHSGSFGNYFLYYLLGVTLFIILLVALSSCRGFGKSSPNKSFPGLRVLEQACLNAWFKKGRMASLRLKESSLCTCPIKAISSYIVGGTSAFFQKSALNSPTITTLPYVGTISWEIYLVLSHGKIYMALSHGKSIWYYLMGNLFGIISWKIYLALSHSWEYERSLPSDEYYLKI